MSNECQTCPKCGIERPKFQFTRLLTMAETLARGYSGQRRVRIETKHCKACRPRRRERIEAFTTPELKEKARLGLIPEITYKMVEKARKAKARATQKAAAHKRWDAVKVRAWKDMLAALGVEFESLQQQRKHARGRTKTANPALALIVENYVNGYLDILRRLRADLILAMRKATDKPEHARWQDYATKDERDQVARLWGTIPPNNAAKMRPPGLFEKEDRSRPVVPLIVAEGEKSVPSTTPMGGAVEESPPEQGSVIVGILDHWDDIDI